MKKLGCLILPLFFLGLLLLPLLMIMTSSGQAQSSGSGQAPVSGEALTVATALYQHEIKVHKATPEGASGSLAVAQRESGFDVRAVNRGGGVAGLFQWSGFLHGLNGHRITAEGSIKTGDTSTLTLENELKLLDDELNGAYGKAKEILQKAKDPAQAALDWSKVYEGVDLSDPQTQPETIQQLARQWLAYFNGKGATTRTIKDLNALLGKTVGSGQCYALTQAYVASISGFQLVGLNAKDIGSDHLSAFQAKGWTVLFNPQAKDLVAGAVINWKEGTVAGTFADNPYGHTGIINTVNGNQFSTYEQNVAGVQTVQMQNHTWDASITSICIPPKQ